MFVKPSNIRSSDLARFKEGHPDDNREKQVEVINA